MDGLLTKIRKPACKEVGHAKAFCSGHCGAHGVGVQDICDSDCKFTAVWPATPGGANSSVAVRNTSLPEMISGLLPLMCHMAGDNACACTEHLLTLCSGINKIDCFKDCHSHLPSQHRIKVGCAFGCLIAKWRTSLKLLFTQIQTMLPGLSAEPHAFTAVALTVEMVSAAQKAAKKLLNFCQTSSVKLKKEGPTKDSH